MRLFLDDEREIPPAAHGMGFQIVRSGEALIEILKKTGLKNVEMISFDHDLGEGMTGYDVVKWIEERVRVHGDPLPLIYIHSANSVGRKNIEAAITSMAAFIWRRDNPS